MAPISMRPNGGGARQPSCGPRPKGHAGAVRALASRGADVHARSTGGLTALLFAVRAGELDAVRALIEARANPNDAASDGTGALAVTIINAHYELAALLLESGADPNAPDPRASALHALAWMRNPGYAAAPPRAQTGRMDSLALARALLDHGANPNARVQWKEIRFDRDGGVVKPPPNISIGRSYLSFVGATPFYIAARGADVALMRLLADYGADPRLPTVQNVTPLMAAAGLGFWDGESPGPESGVPESQALEAVKLAWELGNDVKARTDFGDTRIEGDPTVLLRRHPLNLAAFPETALGDMRWGGSTALHGAAIRGANSVVSFLVEKSADPNAKNGLGWTPLTVAEGVFVANTERTGQRRSPSCAVSPASPRSRERPVETRDREGTNRSRIMRAFPNHERIRVCTFAGGWRWASCSSPGPSR